MNSDDIEYFEDKIRKKTITPNEIVVYMALLDMLNIDILDDDEQN
jgi:hypothetical protein